MPDAPPAFHLLAKPTGAVCNLDCSYCFFLSKEMLYPGSRFRMADELLEAYVRQLIEAHASVPEVTVAWQGGEPTMMGVEFFRRSVELANRYLKPGQKAVYTIQTNGTLLDEEWAQFFKEHEFLVGISIDGPREMHDTYRVNKGGRGSFDQVIRGLEHLKAAGVEWNALTTVHAANGEHGREVYRFLRDECGAAFIQFIPIIERVAEADADGEVPWSSWRDRPLYVQDGDRVTGRSITAAAVRPLPDRRLRGVGAPRRRRGLRADVRRRPGELGRRAARPLRPLRDVRARARARAHRRPLLLRPLRRARATSSATSRSTPMLELVASQQQQQFGLDKRDTLPQFCLECDVRFACHGGCPKDRFIRTPDGEPGLNYLCAGFKDFFHHVDQPMRIMGRLLAQNRAPSEIVQLYASAGRQTRPQRPLHLRLRPQVEALPRRRHAVSASANRRPTPTRSNGSSTRSTCVRCCDGSTTLTRGRPPTASMWSRTATA